MSEWIEYTGSDEQINLIALHQDSVLLKKSDQGFNKWQVWNFYNHETNRIKKVLDDRRISHILLCDRHPYAEIIKIWADTGCPVYVKHKTLGVTSAVHGPSINWSPAEWEFSLKPFEGE